MAAGKLASANPVKNKRTSVKYSPMRPGFRENREFSDWAKGEVSAAMANDAARTYAPNKPGSGNLRDNPRRPAPRGIYMSDKETTTYYGKPKVRKIKSK